MGKKQHARRVEEMIAQHCADFESVTGRKNAHLGFILRCNGQTRKLFTSSTPSDHRAIKNFESDVKRAVREMEEQ